MEGKIDLDMLDPFDQNVAIRVCTRDTPTETCKTGLRRIKDMRPSWDIGIIRNKYSVDMARCVAVASVRDTDTDFLIMIDDDVAPLDPIVNIPMHDKPVVGGIVPTWREGLFFWNAFHIKDDYSALYSVSSKGPDGGLEEVYAVGTAILCIRKDIFNDRSLDPLFEFDRNPDGTMRNVLGGEDVVFCRKMHEIGVPVLIDHAVQGEHHSRINFLETLAAGKKHAPNNPDHCFPSVFAFNTASIPSDEFHADAYLARRRELQERLVGGDREAISAG